VLVINGGKGTVRTVVVGASSGLGRCIGIGLARRGAQVAFLARRRERIENAAREAGAGSVAIACDVTDPESCRTAVERAATELGGIDALVYSPGIGPLARRVDSGVDTWRRAFDINVTGAALVTAAAVPHLTAAQGRVAYLSSISASGTSPWPGLGAYVVSKAALDKLVEAWRVEHPSIGFTRVVVGDCGGGQGDSATGFAAEWNPKLAAELIPVWLQRGLMSGALIDVDDLVAMVDAVLRAGPSVSLPSITVAPKVRAPS
jgi:NAD(P)-dependent dehydrogenase (short-subunit alcohol dehydrogenase family)